MYTTGTSISGISLTLYLVFIGIAIIGMIVFSLIILQGKVDQARIDKMSEIFRSVIITSAIGTVTLIVADLFKERQQNLSEMIAFKEYLPYVTESKNTLEVKLQLADFMVSVCPENSSLQKAWKNWQGKLEKTKAAVAKDLETATIQSAEILRDPSRATPEKIASINSAVSAGEKKLGDVNARSSNSYVVSFGQDKSYEAAKTELSIARKIDTSAFILQHGNSFGTYIPVSGDISEAKSLLNIANQVRRQNNPFIMPSNAVPGLSEKF